ncbi:LPD7 domain-containing protein [Variovorax sp. 770b2]|uniref:LPD7 domain-containing protein n=1 Tax=Variovorax sp. 770b2 TaxID=1566271 RepID=UPI0011606C45|nr:LPD7 domain-containing protein [Variovorax sp. 770b2]
MPNELETRARPGNLGVGEFVVPLSVASRYSTVDGRYFAKDGKKDPMREMFRDHGVRLSTSTTDKAAIADMVSLASAKQWKSLKLSGAQEFRREAWLQAESQGIRTMGYTPRDADIAELRTLTNERSMNRIEPIKPLGSEESHPVARAAPRANLDKNQAFLHTEAAKALASNAAALQEALQGRGFEDVAKLAYWRGVVIEENRHQTSTVRSEVLARFDEQAREPGFLKTIEQQTHGTLDDKTIDRVERSLKRDGHEQSL